MDKLTVLNEAIASRRTIKPASYTGEQVPNAIILQMLEGANWAPTHGYTEPWRFVVYSESGKDALLDTITQITDGSEINPVRYEKRKALHDKASHIIGIGMKRGQNPAIPEIEELLAVGCAVQNMWLIAAAAGYGAYWSTGAVAFDPQLAAFMGLDPETDRALGFLFVGVPATPNPPGRRLTGALDKVVFRKS
jgi:nitroreductase